MSVHTYPLINKMIKLAGLRNELSVTRSDLSEVVFPRPFITISREYGCCGSDVARAVAKKLGFEFVNKQIVAEIAKTTAKRRDIIRSIDEKARRGIDDVIHSFINPNYVSEHKYILELCRVVLTYAYKGHVVILGRGGNFVTPEDKGLHVRVVAPDESKIKNIMEREGCSKNEAKKNLSKVEKDRKEFIKQYFKKDISRVENYDLAINTGIYDVNQASNLILEAFYQKFSRFERYRTIL